MNFSRFVGRNGVFNGAINSSTDSQVYVVYVCDLTPKANTYFLFSRDRTKWLELILWPDGSGNFIIASL